LLDPDKGKLEKRDLFMLRLFFALMGKDFAFKKTEQEFIDDCCKGFLVDTTTGISS
jgi:hypothetical protein